MYRKSYFTTSGVGVGVGVGVSKMIKFLRQSFYVIGKALTGELSCPVTVLVNHDFPSSC